MEERTDYYYNFNISSFGLKERDDDTECHKLELKVKLEEYNKDIIYWEKVIAENIPKSNSEHILFYQIEDIILYYANSDNQRSEQIQAFQPFLDQPFHLIPVHKIRWKSTMTYCGQEMKVEYAEVMMNEVQYHSISLESEDPELIEEFLTQYQLRDLGHIGGYPRIISQIMEIPA